MSQSASQQRHRGPLFVQLCWLIRLRWLAALAVIVCAWVEQRGLGWYVQHSTQLLLTGLAMLFYNALIWWTLHSMTRPKGHGRLLLLLAWVQLLLDVTCLTLLVLWTGAIHSPLTPLFVLHMVFASLLLPRAMAYASAGATIAIYFGALWLTGNWPQQRDDLLITIGRVVALLATVHLANHMMRDLRRQRRRLARQNRSIRAMTRQLKKHQQAMIQHEKMVALGQMAAGVTHEIANPLASMDSLLQLMQRVPERPRPEAVATLREQIDRINQIIQQMKSFAHPADAQQQTVDLNEVVEQALHMLRFDKRLKSVQIDKQLAPNVGTLPLLPQALQQVLVNLIMNALDAVAQTPEPRLLVRTERRDGWCLVEIGDNGPGIAPEHIARLFEPFFTTKPLGKGTGLGLSISYSLVQRQGGSISVRSRSGVGASFTVRLPVGQSPSRNREPEAGGVAVSEKPST